MDRKTAAQTLGVSEKTVARYVSAGRLNARYVRGLTGQKLDFDADDIERLKNELDAPLGKDTQGEVGQDKTSRALATAVQAPRGALQSRNGDPENLLRAALSSLLLPQARTRGDAPFVSTSDKLLLSLDEAAALCGLSRARLRAAISDKRLHARRIGRSWKLRRSDLEAFLHCLFEHDEANTQGENGDGD